MSADKSLINETMFSSFININKSSSGGTVNYIVEEDIALTTLLLTLSIWASVTNGLLLTIFRINSNFGTNESYKLQICFIFCQFGFGLSAIVSAVDHFRVLFWDNWYTSYYCIGLRIGVFVGDLMSLCILLVMASERLFAILCPLSYRNLNRKRFALVSMIASVLFCLFCFGISFYGIDNSIKPSACTGSAARSPLLKTLLAYLKCFLGCFIIIVYITVVLSLHMKARKNKNAQNKSVVEASMKREVKSFRIVSAVVVSCFVFSILPNIILTIITERGFSINRIGPYVTVLGLCDSAVNIFLFVRRDKKIRGAFRNLFKHNNVVPIVSSITPTK